MTDTYRLADTTVHRIGYGAMQLPGPGVMGPPRDRDEALRVLRRAVELGVDHIDTAQFYGPDVSNELIREALHPYPAGLALVTKVGARRDAEGQWLPAQSPADLRADVEANLRSLGTERLTAVNLRRMDEHGVGGVPIEEQLGELAALRDEGKIAGVGVSTVDAGQLDAAIATTAIVCVQNAFSLVDQSDAGVLDRCTAEGIAYVPYFPLGSAFPDMPKVVDRPAVQAVAARLGVPAARVGLAWLLARAENVLLIPGTSSVAHLEDNMAVADVHLSQDDLAELATVTA
ncbi:oxidoreductase [Terracoccus luteus]|uniref:Aryl-alcohol dehydrogenase-like predicted oxidoreductase n=1 Tax=Terracoccus luteus TaxID=53356 RepID=A0A839PS67_9MICO|nr:oxidoreductase [Terracoccus luteus]MBB2986367.1 aryl-alcohol dehydrogenase-like predicted oxidoreductase [Terracoccus luteus]MCP2172043.1 aryl-alcohol dehydrogenase-like predicted oxidoreductase [Terracoccus luteus]